MEKLGFCFSEVGGGVTGVHTGLSGLSLGWLLLCALSSVESILCPGCSSQSPGTLQGGAGGNPLALCAPCCVPRFSSARAASFPEYALACPCTPASRSQSHFYSCSSWSSWGGCSSALASLLYSPTGPNVLQPDVGLQVTVEVPATLPPGGHVSWASHWGLFPYLLWRTVRLLLSHEGAACYGALILCGLE